VNEISFRLRIDYGKTGRLRYLSHLELVRAMERVIRRSQIPFSLTHGFNVHMKHAFGPALPVGTAGEHELMDVWLTEYVPAAELLVRLRCATLPDLPVNEVYYCAEDAPSLQVSRVLFRYELIVEVPDGKGAASLEDTLTDILNTGRLGIIKKARDIEINLAGKIASGPVVKVFENNPAHLLVSMVLRADEQGSLRPDDLINAALKAIPGASIIQITRLELLEES